ncbi:MAG: uroporphyrinogen-III synthase, partial [Gammaproteobacteria bacterium]
LDQGLAMESIKSRVLDFDHYQIAIFISRNAAEQGLAWLENYWPMLPVGVRYYAVGRSTAEVLQTHQIPVEIPANSYDSEGLLALPSLQSVSGQKALIFAGRGGRGALADELRCRGAQVDRCELYERRISTQYASRIDELMAQQKVDVVAIHSGELLQQLFAVLAAESRRYLQLLPVVVPAQRVASLAAEKGCEKVIVAASALPDDMVSAILEWYSNDE